MQTAPTSSPRPDDRRPSHQLSLPCRRSLYSSTNSTATPRSTVILSHNPGISTNTDSFLSARCLFVRDILHLTTHSPSATTSFPSASNLTPSVQPGYGPSTPNSSLPFHSHVLLPGTRVRGKPTARCRRLPSTKQLRSSAPKQLRPSSSAELRSPAIPVRLHPQPPRWCAVDPSDSPQGGYNAYPPQAPPSPQPGYGYNQPPPVSPRPYNGGYQQVSIPNEYISWI